MDIIDDFVVTEIQNNIESTVISANFPWYFIPATAYDADDRVIDDGHNPFQFSHAAVLNGKIVIPDSWELIQPFIGRIIQKYDSDIEIWRAKFNFLAQDTDSRYHSPHSDITADHIGKGVKSLVYYVNDSDGDTYLFNEKVPNNGQQVTINQTVSPKKGRAIIFDPEIFHSSSSPINSQYRIVLNIVFRPTGQKLPPTP